MISFESFLLHFSSFLYVLASKLFFLTVPSGIAPAAVRPHDVTPHGADRAVMLKNCSQILPPNWDFCTHFSNRRAEIFYVQIEIRSDVFRRSGTEDHPAPAVKSWDLSARADGPSAASDRFLSLIQTVVLLSVTTQLLWESLSDRLVSGRAVEGGLHFRIDGYIWIQ